MPGVGGIRVRRGRTASGEGGPGSRRDRCPHGAGRRPGGGRPRAGRAASGLGGVGPAGHDGGLGPGHRGVGVGPGPGTGSAPCADLVGPHSEVVMEGPPSGEAAIDRPRAASKGRPRREHLPVEMAGREDEGVRIFRKLGIGLLGGVFGAYAGLGVGGILGAGQCSGSEEPFCVPGSAFLVGTAGLALGTAAGVSLSDPRARYVPALGGSVAGLVGICGALVGYDTLSGDIDPLDSWELYAAAVFGTPVVVATLASEWFRDPPEDGSLSIRLSPTRGRGFSATAKLRF